MGRLYQRGLRRGTDRPLLHAVVGDEVPGGLGLVGRIALADDHLTLAGGTERLSEIFARAFPGAPVYSALYHLKAVSGDALSGLPSSSRRRLPVLHTGHATAHGLLSGSADAARVPEEVLLVSTSGWTCAYRGARRTVLYHHPRGIAHMHPQDDSRRAVPGAQGLQQADRFLSSSGRGARVLRDLYGVDAEVLPPPPPPLGEDVGQNVPGIEAGFLLSSGPLMPHRRVDIVVRAVNSLKDTRLVVAGDGPDRPRLEAIAGNRVRFLGHVDEAELRWLLRNCSAVVSAAVADHAVLPLQAAAFGRPSVVPRAGGYLDTVVDGATGIFFDSFEFPEVAAAVEAASEHCWSPTVLQEQAARFSEEKFVRRLCEVVAEELR